MPSARPLRARAITTLSLLLALAAAPQSLAQQLELSGYYENQFTPQQIGGDLVLQDYDRLRLDLFSAVDDRITFAGDLVWRVYHGATRLNALDFVPQPVVEAHAAALGATADQLRPQFALSLDAEHFVDNAHVTLYLGRLSLRLGKQQLPWGTGYTWNPTDLFHDKSFLDPTYEKEGVHAFRAEASFGLEGRLIGVLAVGEDWCHTTRAVKVRDHLGGYDLSAVAVETRQEVTDYLSGVTRQPRRRMLGADFSGQALALGLWGEGAHNWLSGGSDFGQYLLGLDYTTVAGTYLMAEYYRNGRGRCDESAYAFGDWMRLLGADGQNLGRDYLSVGASRPARELWTLSAYAIANLSDRSLVAFPWVECSLGDNTELDLVGYVPLGGSLTEFGEWGAGGLARLRVYF